MVFVWYFKHYSDTTWTASFKTFKNEDKARDYIISETRKNTDMEKILGSALLKKKTRQRGINDFCFDDDKYLVHRRYFLHNIPTEFSKVLKDSGINISIFKLK